MGREKKYSAEQIVSLLRQIECEAHALQRTSAARRSRSDAAVLMEDLQDLSQINQRRGNS